MEAADGFVRHKELVLCTMEDNCVCSELGNSRDIRMYFASDLHCQNI